jgi:hypothetical protein
MKIEMERSEPFNICIYNTVLTNVEEQYRPRKQSLQLPHGPSWMHQVDIFFPQKPHAMTGYFSVDPGYLGLSISSLQDSF